MNRRNILLIGAGIVLVVGLCAGAVTSVYFAYSTLVRSGRVQVSDSLFSSPTEIAPTQTMEPETAVGEEVDLASLFSPFWETWELLHEDFVEQPIDNQDLADGALEGLTTLLKEHELNLSASEIPESAPSAEEMAELANTPEEAMEAYRPFWEAWQAAYYLETPEDWTYEILMRVSLGGMVTALDDPYTGFLTPDDLIQWNSGLEGEYEGIGAWVDTTTEFLTIISPMPGSPAEEAGLEPGDRILAIDGEDMTGIDGEIVIRSVLGPAGSLVILTIERDEVEEAFDVEVTRGKITIPNVDSEMLEGDIAYLALFTFGSESHADLRDALEELLAQNPKGLILDLRGNGGGFLHSAVNITSEFIEDGVLLYEEYGDGTRNIHEARSFEGLAIEIPLVVLVDEGTASASEILAGAVQAYERGTLVGATSFGKGSVQIVHELSNQQGAVRVTVARWLTPDERHIHGQGLEPDYIVEFTEEDIEEQYDRQLEKAIELLTN